MMYTRDIEGLKRFAPIIVNSIPDGMVILITNLEKAIWRLASDVFDVPELRVGTMIRADGGSQKAMQTRTVTTEKVARHIYGTRIVMTSIPIINDDQAVEGVVVLVTPRIHPVVKAFNDFAPIMADMLHEGVFLYATDLNEVIRRQGSDEFNIAEWTVGSKLGDDTVAKKTMINKKAMSDELNAERYGTPVMIINHPLFDEDDPTQVIGSFGFILPRTNAIELRNMANDLSRSMEEISAVIQELAASASLITTNEQELNNNIADIFKLSEDINEVVSFIKQIADETKMLGLNAAIEAARAGEVGKGFGVVAEEIRKLSDQSKNTVTQINNITKNIKDKAEHTLRNSEQTLKSSEEQAAASQEISATVEEITRMSGQMKKIANKL